MNKFTPDFLLGAATAAHQVEGNNTNSDCWAMEQMEHSSYTEPSLDAVDHYHRYPPHGGCRPECLSFFRRMGPY